MRNFKISALQELTDQQVRFAPPARRLEQMARAEKLLTEIALATRERLQAVYAAPDDDVTKRARKQEILAAARSEYLARCGGLPSRGQPCPLTGWFDSGLNNARLNAVATYEHWVPAFTALIRAADKPGHPDDLAAFFRTAKALAELPRRERDAVLRALAPPDGVATP